ncbi:MAG TPA: GNAT family N-acetyltransferase [Candidatus Dormibacteraeota bacterium]|jgi:GNAT superfamily N-acetyltransferase
MIGELLPARVEPSTAGSDYWSRYHELRRVRQIETRPDDPLRPDEVEEQQIKREDPFEFKYRYEISEGGTMLSSFGGQTLRPTSPEYESNKHLFWADIYVRPDRRRQGIATMWLPVMVELMDRHGCTVLGIGTEEEAGHAFLRWLGAEPKLSGAENRLKLADVDWAMVRRWVDEGGRRSPHTRLEVHDAPMSDDVLKDFAPQLSVMLNTIPFEELDHGDIIVTPAQIREWEARMAMSGEVVHTLLTRESDGEISSITDVNWAPYRPAIIHQQFTGVLPSARGRGLGKWIKAAMLLHLREVHPQAEWISTDNAGSNAPMLGINKKLGFRQYRAATEYQVTRDAIAAKLEALAAI